MNIFFRELKANRKALIIWSICMILFVILGMQKYYVFQATKEGMTQLLNILKSAPKFIQSLWGMTTMDITTPIGYYSILFFYLALMGAIHAGMLGANIIAKEERDKTAEFLMAKPVSRITIITSKIAASLINVITVNLAAMIPSIIILNILSDDSIVLQMTLSTIGLFLIQIIFLVIGTCTAAICKKPARALSLTMAILLGCFTLSFVIDSLGSLQVLSFLTPFKYFDAKDFLVSGHLSLFYIALSIIIITAILLVTYKEYIKKDLSI